MVSAASLWHRLAGQKGSLMTRAERFAALTIPKLMLPDGHNKESDGQARDYQSIGAQAVNHVTNKLMLAMFRPSAPFFRLQLGQKTRRRLDPKAVAAAQKTLSLVEQEAMRRLDARSQRTKLYAVIRHLVAIGNVLLIREKNTLRVMSLRYYCVKRTLDGRIHTLITREEVEFDELAPEVQEAFRATNRKRNDNTKVSYYRVVKLVSKDNYTVDQWVDEVQLDPAKFSGRYTSKTLPYHALVWDLADEHNYGTGLVEEYEGDFEAASAMSEAVVDGAVLGTEYRFMLDPTSSTSADDLNKSQNGDTLPGRAEDLTPIQGGNPQAVEMALRAMQHWEQRLARGFLLLSAVTRDAERVTAEEVRLTAQELETAYGGVYSNLSSQIQEPLAHWLLEDIDMSVEGADVEVQVITGLDALSRNGDLEAFRLAMSDLAQIAALPPMLLARLKFKEIADFVGQGRGVDLSNYVMEDEEFAQLQAAQQESAAAGAAQIAAGETAGANIGARVQ